jgi:hypothetical protein
MSADV